MRYIAVLLVTLLSGCQLTPQAPPAATGQPQEITRAQSYGLPQTGSIHAQVRGSPDDALRSLADQARQHGAVYYRVLLLDETRIPGDWYAMALLYGTPVADRQTPYSGQR